MWVILMKKQRKKIWINKSRKQRKRDVIDLKNSINDTERTWLHFISDEYTKMKGITVICDKDNPDDPPGFVDGFVIINSHMMFNFEVISSECYFLDDYKYDEVKHALNTKIPNKVLGFNVLPNYQYGIGLQMIVPNTRVTREDILRAVKYFVDICPMKLEWHKDQIEFNKTEIIGSFSTEEIESLRSRVVF